MAGFSPDGIFGMDTTFLNTTVLKTRQTDFLVGTETTNHYAKNIKNTLGLSIIHLCGK